MRFSTFIAALALSSAALVSAQKNITVTVGQGGNLTYTPDTLTADLGDTVTFVFTSRNHTVSQSTFADPCTQFVNSSSPDTPLTSGYKFVDTNSSAFPVWSIQITQKAPIWFFCAQTTPKNHCAAGMVGAINAPTTGNTFEAYKAKALAVASAPASASGSAAAAPSATGSAAAGASATGSAVAGASATGSAAAGSSATGTASAGAASSTTSGAPSSALGTVSPAAISSILLSLVGVAFGVML